MKRAFRFPSKPNLTPLYARLREKRIARNISQLDAAVALGYHVNTVSSWETGARHPTLPALYNWAEFLDVELSWKDKKEPGDAE
jgi:transcriptional regulator with XRE-family HTH domain